MIDWILDRLREGIENWGHPDEINAKEISLGRQMNTDTHGKKIIFRLRRGKASLTTQVKKAKN